MVSTNYTRLNSVWTVPGNLQEASLTVPLWICGLWSSWLEITCLHKFYLSPRWRSDFMYTKDPTSLVQPLTFDLLSSVSLGHKLSRH